MIIIYYKIEMNFCRGNGDRTHTSGHPDDRLSKPDRYQFRMTPLICSLTGIQTQIFDFVDRGTIQLYYKTIIFFNIRFSYF